MKKLIFGLFCASLGVGEAAAQQAIPPLKKEFLDSTFAVLPSAAGAYYRRETEYTDSLGGIERDYYLKSNQLQSRGKFENLRTHIGNGIFETWYENGQLESHAETSHGQPNGEYRCYYAGGQLQSQATYAAGKLVTSQCLNLNGQPMECPIVVEAMPVYSEGDGSAHAVVEAVARNFRYPRKAVRTGVGGRVIVGFDVNPMGNVANVHIEQSVSPALDVAAMEAVQKLKRFRPGTQDGKPVTVQYRVPLNLKVQ